MRAPFSAGGKAARSASLPGILQEAKPGRGALQKARRMKAEALGICL